MRSFLPYQKIKRCLFFCLVAISSSTIVNAQSAVRFNGSSSHIKCGNNAALRFLDFTLEAWIKIEGRGLTVNTGGGGGVGGNLGLTNVIPLITRGRADVDGTASREINYFLGYDSATRKLMADFEDRNASSNNHAVLTNIVLDTCSWVHVAVTCKGSTGGTRQWVFYVNGVLSETIAIAGTTANEQPQDGSLAPLAFGTAINYTGSAEGTPTGYFQGKMDEIRVWNVVRTPSEISTNYATELTTGTGLMGRWGLSEGSTSTTANSISGAYGTGTLVSTSLWTKNFNSTDGSSALDFDGANDYISFGAAPKLNTPSFTLEAWIRMEGAGVTTTTGTGGIAAAIPIIAKGRGEAETPTNLNMNYFLGIDNSTGQLAADFEEGYNGTSAPNHPVVGNTILAQNTWYHVAVTYGSGEWKLYVNGVLDKTKTEAGSPIPEINSIQHASIGSALTSTGVAAGFFNGKIDEVRIWNTVKTQVEIQSNMFADLSSSPNLVGRWGMNENQFNFVESSAGNSCGIFGTLLGTAPLATWTGANFAPLITEATPFPANGATNYNGNTFSIIPTHSSASAMSVTLYTRIINTGNFAAISTNTGVSSGTLTSFTWPAIQANTTYEWYVSMTDGVTVVNGKVYTVSTAGFIPIKLVSFEGAVLNNQVQLKWSTFNEKDNDYFQVERSTDGKNFSPIGKVKGQLNATHLSNYSFIDPSPEKGISYYQLKQVDIDENFSVSKIVRVTVTDKSVAGLVIFPNPISGSTIHLSFQEPVSGPVLVKIFDLSGRIQVHQKLVMENQNIHLKHSLQAGVYFLRVTTGQKEYHQKIIVQ